MITEVEVSDSSQFVSESTEHVGESSQYVNELDASENHRLPIKRSANV